MNDHKSPTEQAMSLLGTKMAYEIDKAVYEAVLARLGVESVDLASLKGRMVIQRYPNGSNTYFLDERPLCRTHPPKLDIHGTVHNVEWKFEGLEV